MSTTLATDENFSSLARNMGKILEHVNKGYYSFYTTEIWTPNVNLYETEDAYQVCVDLAGVEQEKIDIAVHDSKLTIRGARAAPIAPPKPGEADATPRRARVHLMEIDHGSFARVVELPHNVVSNKITAEHRNGILWIELPKR